jgi:hypothetical protein
MHPYMRWRWRLDHGIRKLRVGLFYYNPMFGANGRFEVGFPLLCAKRDVVVVPLQCQPSPLDQNT